MEGSRCIDDRIGRKRLRAVAILVADIEGRLVAAHGLHLVEAGPRKGDDAGPGADVCLEWGARRQGPKVIAELTLLLWDSGWDRAHSTLARATVV